VVVFAQLHDVVDQIFGHVFDEHRLPPILDQHAALRRLQKNPQADAMRYEKHAETTIAKEQAALLHLHQIHRAEAMRYQKRVAPTTAKEQAALLRLNQIHREEAMRYEKLLNETRAREEAHRKQHQKAIRRALQVSITLRAYGLNRCTDA
jgi:hypothetical protein